MDSLCMMMSDWLLHEPQTLLVLHHTGHGNHGSPFASKICGRKQKAFITSLGFDKKLRLEVHTLKQYHHLTYYVKGRFNNWQLYCEIAYIETPWVIQWNIPMWEFWRGEGDSIKQTSMWYWNNTIHPVFEREREREREGGRLMSRSNRELQKSTYYKERLKKVRSTLLSGWIDFSHSKSL